ncbi:4-(cytidine 5'-diphospho)-2-C-methyl-D-erythritol kinase [Sandarakinorhabdus sp. AAP62]|uniref:4-(cytidine 5'-diphospho)-2-C-methyl-D-erythritol kinase n=1 Tax=Sandarakinorhabdus sp. AAP62 TaxID=1248916 RepID=UPI00030F27BC|nr:4-(cytidine 5'-diphospho)-2-C-methyl-D-erythritol kinase [Sandarakinorhabdus sp. AAP62]
MIIEPAPAKINLALHLRRRRPDGYHDLESIFAFTAFGDTLRGEAGEGLSLTLSGPTAAAADVGDDNLVLRAGRALAAAAGIVPNAALHLEKRIPVAAGLGGGSADAAAALRLLNRLWGLDWPLERLAALAAPLGADVPVCVYSRTLFGAGKGEALSHWPHDPAGTPILLVNPRVAVATGPVFAGWDQQDRGPIDAAVPLTGLRNDMTAAAIVLQPVIADVLSALERGGEASLVRMSGSGATCLALYADDGARDRAAAALATSGWWLCPTHII